MDIKTPKRWRKGQTIFNFLWWLQSEKGYSPEPGVGGRMADPFGIPNKEFDTLYDEFLQDWGNTK